MPFASLRCRPAPIDNEKYNTTGRKCNPKNLQCMRTTRPATPCSSRSSLKLKQNYVSPPSAQPNYSFARLVPTTQDEKGDERDASRHFDDAKLLEDEEF